MAKRVFLDGTVNGSDWRSQLVEGLRLEYFDPVVEVWTEADYERELRERERCDYLLYVITPMMSGVYSIAEAVDDSNKHPQKTLFCILKDDQGQSFAEFQQRSLRGVERMISSNGARIFDGLDGLRDWLNQQAD